MKQYVYSVEGSNKKLIYMDDEDEKGNIIYSIDHQVNPPLERKSKYDDLLIIEEIELENDQEVNRITYSYDDQKRIVSQKRFLNNELIEEVRTDYVNNKTTTIRTDGILVLERSVHIENADGTKRTEFSEFGELFEIQMETYDAENRVYKTDVFNGNNELFTTIVEKVDEKDRIVSYHKFDKEGNSSWEQQYVRDGDLVVQLTYVDHYEKKGEVHAYLYDEFENEIEVVVENLQGSKIGYDSKKIDENGNVLEAKGIRGSKYFLLGPPFLHPSVKDYHLIFEYKE